MLLKHYFNTRRRSVTTFFDDLYNQFHELHTDLVQTIEGLPPEALDWVPGDEMNSINILIVHLTGAERYWIGVVLDKPPERDREQEFKVHGLSLEEVKERLSGADEYIHQGLMRLSTKDLMNVHLSPRNQKTVTAGWAVLHALEHTAIHAGHVQLTRQLWEKHK
jgi:uncharacterized damage-inducible protein DinB